MKLYRIKKTSVILAFALYVLLHSSCKENVVNEVKVTDFATLESQFSEPPAEYTSSPFFVWNAEITKDEIDKHLTGFKNAGSSQVFIHPRPGLITEYLSEDWLELYKHTVEKGKELGMKVWIYDENSYPSGFAGGHVPNEMPESYNQGQGLVMTRVETLPDTCDKYYLCLKEEEGSYKDITTTLEEEKDKTGKYMLFSKTYYGKSDWFGGFSYVDLLYPGVTQKFLEVTMTGYEKHIGTEFGETVPGIFTDEPEIGTPGGIRWTPDLFDVFMKEWGYDLRTQLPSLYEEVGDWKKVRHNYTQTLLHLFIERWSKPMFEYCEEKGLIFTGHYWEHGWPSMHLGGDNMAMYAWHQMPAIDMLFNQWNDVDSRAQFGNVRSVKELASAANQTGRHRKLSETYGGGGWELTFTDMKRLGDWEYALGVNFMNQHLTYFTLAGARKYDYPPSFDYHEPWWNNYKYLNDHYSRLSLALSAGRQINDILILEPTTSAWLYDSYINRNKKCDEIGQAFQAFVTELEKSQVEYDLGSENIIKDRGSVSKGKFIVGQGIYETVVIPPMTENLDQATFDLIEKFVSVGGKLVAFSKPSLVDGSENERLKDMFINKPGNILIIDELSDDIISSHLKNRDLVFTGLSGGDLYHHRRIMNDGQVIFLANSSLTDAAEGSLEVAGKDVVEMNTLSGELTGYPGALNDNKINISWSIPPAGSLLLFISDKEKDYPVTERAATMVTVETNSNTIIKRDGENALMIDFCDIELGNTVLKELHTFNAADTIFKHYGFKNGNPWNTSVQFKRNTVDRDTFGINTGFKVKYYFTVKGKFDMTSIKMVVERQQLWKVSINGTEVKAEEGKWWIDRLFNVFNIGSLVRQGQNTITLTASPMRIHSEVEPVYITGDFSVTPDKKGFIIEAPALAFKTGSWKSQGMPFYSWGVTYSREFNIDASDGTWEVSLGKWNGTMAEVYVNDQPATVIAFPPYKTDVSALIRPGLNRIDVKVIGSLKNLLGPHHNNPPVGIAGPWLWRNIKTYPSGSDYQQFEYGLFDDFILSKGE
jgi:hypothetical protein